jgi:hypothetical protein
VSRDIRFLGRTLKVELKIEEAKNVADLRVLQDKFYAGLVDYLFPTADRRGTLTRALAFESLFGSFLLVYRDSSRFLSQISRNASEATTAATAFARTGA